MNRNWKIYLIHHSHTDIGYTERQDKIARYHSDFICQAIDILNEIHEGKRDEAKGFVWQCENFWQVKNFYETASESYRKDFEKYARTGEIGLSGNYLNLTELISYDVLYDHIAMAKEYGKKIGRPVQSAMCADINGMAWGYADALWENDVKALFTCIHTHHGMFPLYRKLQPFYWESPKGNKILVWNGEYYHMGNELFFAPGGGSAYQIRDEYYGQLVQNMILNHSAEETQIEERRICRTRLERYLEKLEEENYPVSFVPFMVSGCITDNAPPSAALAERVNWLNEEYSGKIHIEMVNLDRFFEEVRKQFHDIPCYRGDLNDWWADGIGSTPGLVMIYLDARRKLDLCKKLDENSGEKELVKNAEENLILFAEHTWGYSSSVIEPWEPLVGNLEWKKAGYAVNANTAVSKYLDMLLAERGEISIRQNKGQTYRIINPHSVAVKMPAYLFIENWEYVEGLRFGKEVSVQVIDVSTGEIIPSQVSQTARAFQVEILISMNPGERKDVRIVPAGDKKPVTVKNLAAEGAEGVFDLIQEMRKDIGCVETGAYRVEFEQRKGIRTVYDKKNERNLIRNDAKEAAFSGIYEVTEGKEDPRELRRSMGRNRKSPRTKRYYSRLRDIRILEQGAVYTAVVLDYEMEGCNLYQVYLKIYEDSSLMEARVRIHKQSIWDPENLYIALPFTAGEESVAWIDKTGCILRPGIDQLPGTNQEFYLLQNGVVWECGQACTAAAIPNAPLIVMGSLEAGSIRLCDGKNWEKNRSCVYSWVMNNYWETNFKAETGGFYEFTYRIMSGDRKKTEENFAVCEAVNEGLLSFYIRQ